MTKKQKALLREVEKDPEANLHEIGCKLKELDIVKDKNYPYQITKRNQEIANKIAIKREKYELATVNLYPSAKKVVKQGLKDNNLDAAKLVFRHALPIIDDSKRPPIQQTVNIGAIQQIIYNELKEKDQEAIEVTSKDNDE